MQTFQITAPNTCALVILGADITYIPDWTGTTAQIGAPDGSTFEEFLTPEDAATRALVLDPGYDVSLILGPIPSTVDTESGSGSYFYGDPVVLQYVVSSSLAGTTIAYQWKDEAGLDLPGETTSTLNLGGASASVEGGYSCEVTLTSTDGRINEFSGSFTVRTYPVAGEFTLTRSGNDITTGLFTFLKGFAASTATIEVPAIPLTISYDPTDGFKTTGSPLLAADQVAEIFINGEFVRSVTIHAVDGTFNYNFSA